MAALHSVPLLREALQHETLSSGNCALSMLVAPKRRPSFVSTRAAVTTLPTGCGRVTLKFEELKKRGKVALIPYIAAGYPDLETTAEALRLLSTMGADIIELGVPYSDPLADGPVIQEAYTTALANGVTLDCVLDMLRKVQPTLSAPIVLFTYFNPILRRGLERFFEDIRAAGVSGLIVPDVPLEETAKLREVSTTKNIDLILLATPTSPLQRMEEIAKSSQGFVYLIDMYGHSHSEKCHQVSITGVTGARTSMDSRVKRLISDLKMVTDKPISVGFGVSKPEHVAQVVDWGADGVIIGSSVVKLLGQSGSPAEGLAALKSYITEIKAALP